jgi:hypothetical protein
MKQLLLVPLDMHIKDFEIFWIFKKFFVFIIDSPKYSPPGGRDSPDYRIHFRGVVTLQWWIYRGADLNCFTKYKIHEGVGTTLWFIHWTRILLLTCSDASSKYIKKSTPRCIHHRGVETAWCIHHSGVETPQCIHHMGVENPRCIHHRGVVLDTGESFHWF